MMPVTIPPCPELERSTIFFCTLKSSTNRPCHTTSTPYQCGKHTIEPCNRPGQPRSQQHGPLRLAVSPTFLPPPLCNPFPSLANAGPRFLPIHTLPISRSLSSSLSQLFVFSSQLACRATMLTKPAVTNCTTPPATVKTAIRCENSDKINCNRSLSQCTNRSNSVVDEMRQRLVIRPSAGSK